MAIGFAEVVDRDDVAMLQGARRARLPQEPGTRVLGAPDGAAQDLERDVVADVRVVRLPHGSHRAFSDELVQPEIPNSAILIVSRHAARSGLPEQCARRGLAGPP